MKEVIKEEAVFINSFKNVRLDGHAIRTIYCMTKSGIVSIERRIVSTELNIGFELIRKFGKYYYQRESMVFKMESFLRIVKGVNYHFKELDLSKVIKTEDILYKPNEKTIIRLTNPKAKKQ